MHHLFVALRCHSDIAKFEFEDGVVRQAGAALLAEESTISVVEIDIATERTLALDNVGQPSEWAGTMTISSESPDDVNAEMIAELVAEVAVVDQAWTASSTQLADLDGQWAGTVTPGLKVSLVVTPAAGMPQTLFHQSLEAKLTEVHAELPDVGHALISASEDSGQHYGVASFSFPSEAALNAAAQAEAFSPILAADLVDPQNVQILMAVEHRLTPNPNAWAMPTEPLMPIRDDPSE